MCWRGQATGGSCGGRCARCDRRRSGTERRAVPPAPATRAATCRGGRHARPAVLRRWHGDLAAQQCRAAGLGTEHATLALVRQSLIGRFRIPPSVSIENIETHAGGYLAFRFACEADLRNIDPNDLPPGTAVPGKVYYVSRLTPDHQRHEVTVRIFPLLKMEKVQ